MSTDIFLFLLLGEFAGDVRKYNTSRCLCTTYLYSLILCNPEEVVVPDSHADGPEKLFCHTVVNISLLY